MGKGVPVLSHRFTPQLGAQESEEAKGQDPGDTPLPNHNVLFLRNWDGEIQRETQGQRQKDRERDSQRAQNSCDVKRLGPSWDAQETTFSFICKCKN